ncbi:MAG: SPFH domain-containing protein [Myxococcales bacterium]|nr:SPFH domain-containing protein [Myxococcales bacterium]
MDPLNPIAGLPIASSFAAAGLGDAVLAAALLGILVLVFVAMARSLLYICRPSETLIVTGRRRIVDGVDMGPLVVLPTGRAEAARMYPGAGAGHVWRIPILERIDRMDLTAMPVDIVVRDAYSKGNIPLQIHAIANVKVAADPKLLRNAIERFLGRSRGEIALVAQQTLEGAVREVLAQMTPEQVNEDRLAFAENLIESAKDDLDKLGIQLDTLKIQNVQDKTGYLDSLGRPAIARALRDAENAENQAMQEIAEAQAAADQRAQVARAGAETSILRKQNELSKVAAELEGVAQAVEREAAAAASTARAQAEVELQQVRGVLEQKRLEAEVVVPAEVRRAAVAVMAQGDAAMTIENGKAVVQVLEATADAWRQMGSHARELFVIQHLEELVEAVQDKLVLSIGEVSVLDPGDGSALANYAAAYPHAVAAVLRAIGETTGVDVPAILAGPGARDEAEVA